MKNERGITLLSLVVTIIVLLILTGVALNGSLLENGGLFNQVKDETKKQQDMVQDEKDKMNTTLQDIEEEWGIGPNA